MTLPPKLLAFLVSERLAGKYRHGIVRLANKKQICRCGKVLGQAPKLGDMVEHLDDLRLWDTRPYQWETVIDWKD